VGREKVRSLFSELAAKHLQRRAPFLVDVPLFVRLEALRVMVKTTRRQTIFPDDHATAVQALNPLWELLAPRVEGVVAFFLLDSTGELPPDSAPTEEAKSTEVPGADSTATTTEAAESRSLRQVEAVPEQNSAGAEEAPHSREQEGGAAPPVGGS
jgi:hypothetical protein